MIGKIVIRKLGIDLFKRLILLENLSLMTPICLIKKYKKKHISPLEKEKALKTIHPSFEFLTK